MPTVEHLTLRIQSRFQSDAANIAAWLFDEVVQIDNDPDFTVEIKRALIDEATTQAQLRLDLAVDSAAWQGYELGRLDAMVEDDETDLFDWELEPGANHCDTCLLYHEAGPYTLDTLPGIPGQAPTICNGSCRCNIAPHKG